MFDFDCGTASNLPYTHRGDPRVDSHARGERHMLATLFLLLSLPAAGEPISLHPDNPHYLLFRGKPTVLITSTEHYGAVLNGDFDADSLPRRAARPRPQPHPHVLRHVSRGPRLVQDREQHARAQAGTSTSAPGLASETKGAPTAATSSISPAGTTPTSTASRSSSRPPRTAASSSSSCCSAPSTTRTSGRSTR